MKGPAARAAPIVRHMVGESAARDNCGCFKHPFLRRKGTNVRRAAFEGKAGAACAARGCAPDQVRSGATGRAGKTMRRIARLLTDDSGRCGGSRRRRRKNAYDAASSRTSDSAILTHLRHGLCKGEYSSEKFFSVRSRLEIGIMGASGEFDKLS